MNIVIECGYKVQKQLEKENNSRYRSWEHCYKSFQKAYNKKKDEEPNYDYLSLQLAFYLASWGMYRATSFLFWKDYTVHNNVVRILLEKDSLWKIEINEDKNQNLEKYYEDLMTLKEEIKKEYNKYRTEVYMSKSKNQPIGEITDALISKVILGTIGCIPAYDSFFIRGIRSTKKIRGIFNEKSVRELIEYYKDNYKDLEKLRRAFSQNKKVEYSQMKVLDSCFWQYGIDQKK